MTIYITAFGATFAIEPTAQLKSRFRVYVDGGVLANGREEMWVDTLASAFHIVHHEIEALAEDYENSSLS
jgi:hypothetical protein